jgi:pimeloyl-ACP methyl ester carboxylesterase
MTLRTLGDWRLNHRAFACMVVARRRPARARRLETRAMTLPEHGATPLNRWLEAAWAHEAAVREVPVEGATVCYRAWGLEATERPGLVFIHGFLAHARWWDHIAPHFADRFRVVALDLSGMGDSGRRQAYSRRQYGREILAVAEHAGMTEATLIAHSFGSVSALYAARVAPDRTPHVVVPHVIVIDAHVFRDETPEARASVVPDRTYARHEEALARYRLIPPGLWPLPAITRYVAEHSLRQTDGIWHWKADPQAARSVRDDGMRDEIRGLDCTVDFVHGANSEVVGAAEIATFLANAPTCRGPVTVPLSHHHIMIEQPVGLVAALNGLLAGT